MDGWLRCHIAADSDANGPFTMGYYEAADIPFQYALAERVHHLRQLLLLRPGADPSQPLHVDDRAPSTRTASTAVRLSTTTRPTAPTAGPPIAERLQNAGVSWKCYQQADNYGTNVLEFFSQFIDAPPSSSLYQSAFGVSTLFNGHRPATPPWPSRRTVPTARCRP